MNFDLPDSLQLAIDTVSGRDHGCSLENLPVFRAREDHTASRNDPKSLGSRGRRQTDRETKSKFYTMPPLAAYSAFSEHPFYHVHKATGSKFDPFEMRLELSEKQQESIRMLGWDSIRPVGIGFTMKERKDLAKLEAKEQERQQQQGSHGVRDLLSTDRPQENVNTPQQTTLPHEAVIRSLTPPDMDINLDQDIHEDETSYDYDDEFARIEPDDDVAEPHNARDDNYERAERTVQQFIETSHIEGVSHPYDMENNYQHSYNYSDNEDSGSLALPPVTIPDIEAYDVGINGPEIADINSGGASPPLPRQRRQRLRSPFDVDDLGCD
ncbi:Mnd2p [Lachancea thermotolerans CBS 6340]|uniref:KLTH0C00704p n=1 Tax=Lachancea thermotolerans (strain ATCC 56472 / CBS 6340 / NRRL Y-8284) TaxID=559295 RepID=C5DDG0_LACTC|nr:KLTH0C00704p [Lachancea thermotolerans CBS 6340]CAR21821.1 KLTH0C00704p [Lachancea thermotolerans CBS 6340]